MQTRYVHRLVPGYRPTFLGSRPPCRSSRSDVIFSWLYYRYGTRAPKELFTDSAISLGLGGRSRIRSQFLGDSPLQVGPMRLWFPWVATKGYLVVLRLSAVLGTHSGLLVVLEVPQNW
eukprot:3765840-Rhodomonas_salina.2